MTFPVDDIKGVDGARGFNLVAGDNNDGEAVDSRLISEPVETVLVLCEAGVVVPLLILDHASNGKSNVNGLRKDGSFTLVPRRSEVEFGAMIDIFFLTFETFGEAPFAPGELAKVTVLKSCWGGGCSALDNSVSTSWEVLDRCPRAALGRK